MFITAVCVLFFIKLRWPRNESLYRIVLFSRGQPSQGGDEPQRMTCDGSTKRITHEARS